MMKQLSVPDSETDASNSSCWWNPFCLRDVYSAENELDRSWNYSSCYCSRSHRHRKTNRFILLTAYCAVLQLLNVNSREWCCGVYIMTYQLEEHSCVPMDMINAVIKFLLHCVNEGCIIIHTTSFDYLQVSELNCLFSFVAILSDPVIAKKKSMFQYVRISFHFSNNGHFVQSRLCWVECVCSRSGI